MHINSSDDAYDHEVAPILDDTEGFDDLDDLEDPYEIVAAMEEELGYPLFFHSVMH